MRTKKVKILNDISIHRSSLLSSHKSIWIVVLLIVFSFIQHESTYAQLARFPVQRKNPSSISKSKKEVARTKDASLSLPFWDDFSFTPVNDTSNAESNLPLSSLWSRGDSVWVNDGLGINVPTINVASFDGLDSLGLPYSDEVLENGFRDELRSQPINLDAVIGADTSTVFLSFFYQWQGNGEPPDPSDYMRIEFKDSTDAWIDILTINTKSSFDKTVFYDTILQVKGKRFLHDTFQFRFRNYGRRSGPFDTWNIDYVYLNKGRTINDTSFPDQAVASSFSPLFGSYYAMPIKHFFAAPLIDSVEFDVNNLMNNVSSIAESYVAKALFTNHSNSSFDLFESVLDPDSLVDDGTIEAFERNRVKLYNLPNPNNPSQFDPSSDSIEVELKVKISTNGELPGVGDAFLPYDLHINDSTSTHYYLDDYYAYDDGIAEYSVGLTHAGNRLAYQFTRPANIPDSLAVLNGFYIYFPKFGVTNSLTVDFTIYADDGGKPGDVLYTIPSYLIKPTGINVFQLVPIREIVLVGTTYYIGWKAPVNGSVVVGLDVSNNTGDKMIVYTNGQWDVNDAVEGSIMLRPRFGEADVVTGIADEEKSLQIFPNPSKGEFYIKGKYDRMEIITVTGQSIPFTSNQESDNTRITILSPTSGLYVLKIIKGNALQTRKIVID